MQYDKGSLNENQQLNYIKMPSFLSQYHLNLQQFILSSEVVKPYTGDFMPMHLHAYDNLYRVCNLNAVWLFESLQVSLYNFMHSK